jgi:predicted metalloprotease with PDZ domain
LGYGVTLNTVADTRPKELVVTANRCSPNTRALVDQEAVKLFGARHFDHYDFLPHPVTDRMGGIGLDIIAVQRTRTTPG